MLRGGAMSKTSTRKIQHWDGPKYIVGQSQGDKWSIYDRSIYKLTW